LTRCLVIFGACAGLCYNALWYFPVLIVIGGFATVVWDIWLRQQVGKLRAKRERKRRDARSDTERVIEGPEPETTAVPEARTREGAEGLQRRTPATGSKDDIPIETPDARASRTEETQTRSASNETPTAVADMDSHAIPTKVGISIIAGFLSTRTPVPLTLTRPPPS
jgi:hypothetical protein